MATATVTNGGKDLYAQAMREFIDARIKYVAVGTSSTAPSSSQTALGGEVFRKVMTQTDDGGGTGDSIFTLYLSPQDAVGSNIQEVGWFGGEDADATAGSGVMIARGLLAHGTKSGNESIVLTFTPVFS